MNTHKRFTALLAAMFCLGILSSAPATAQLNRKETVWDSNSNNGNNPAPQREARQLNRKETSTSRGINGADSVLHQSKNSYVTPYVPNDLTSVDYRGAKPSVMCTEEGALEPANNHLSGSCLDYRSPSQGTSWRVRYVVQGRQGGYIERILQCRGNCSGNSMTTWVVFNVSRDYEGRVLYASAGAQQQYLASRGRERNQRDPEIANSNQNSPPIQGLPNVGGIPLGTILNEVLRKGK